MTGDLAFRRPLPDMALSIESFRGGYGNNLKWESCTYSAPCTWRRWRAHYWPKDCVPLDLGSINPWQHSRGDAFLCYADPNEEPLCVTGSANHCTCSSMPEFGYGGGLPREMSVLDQFATPASRLSPFGSGGVSPSGPL